MKTHFVIFISALTLGLILGQKHSTGGTTYSGIRARLLQIQDPGSKASIVVGSTPEGSGFWIKNGSNSASVQGGVHESGLPFLLVSDGAIRNFGLGRVDGKNRAPILVFRSDDLVKMVFGLSMTEPGQPAFLVHYSSDGKKTDFLGHYCNDPGRICTQ